MFFFYWMLLPGSIMFHQLLFFTTISSNVPHHRSLNQRPTPRLTNVFIIVLHQCSSNLLQKSLQMPLIASSTLDQHPPPGEECQSLLVRTFAHHALVKASAVTMPALQAVDTVLTPA
jgi:hypothetical protein